MKSHSFVKIASCFFFVKILIKLVCIPIPTELPYYPTASLVAQKNAANVHKNDGVNKI